MTMSARRPGGTPRPAPSTQTLDGIRAITDPVERAIALREYLDRLERMRTQAIILRDETLRGIDTGPTETAKATGWSVSTVKLARRPR